MIDVLRASTTIVTALANGASRVRPVLEVAEARACVAAGAPGPAALLGGERGGLRIAGFDMGNSPLEYVPRRVSGRPVVITTTNGTAAVAACAGAAAVLVGAIVNRAAVAAGARQLADTLGANDIHLVCAGTDGVVTEEDLLAAGAILDAAARHDEARGDDLDDAAREALDGFRTLLGADGRAAPDRIIAAFATSRGGRNLVALGMQADLGAAAAIDSLPLVPRLDRDSGWLVADTSVA